MFGRKEKNESAPAVIQAGVTVAPEVAEHIRVMPERFYLTPRSRSNRTFLVVGLLVIVVGVLTAVALAVWKFGPAPVAPRAGTEATPTPVATPTVVPTVEPAAAPTEAPIVQPAVQPTLAPKPVAGALPPPVGGSTDDDGDGLTFNEERLYTTQPNVSDSDGDGFLDGAEVRHGYSPRDPSGRTLVDDGLFTAVTTGFGFRWAYPAGWLTQESVEGGGSSVHLDTKLGESVEAARYPMFELPALLERWGNPDVSEVTVNGITGARTNETVPRYYFITPDRTAIVAVAYDADTAPSFLATYEAMVGTFQWGP